MGKMVSRGLALAMIAGAFTAPTALAEGEFSANVALTSDYVWRGISQSDSDFAVQGGFDYANGAFYVGTWASSVDFGDGSSTELDLYGGVAGETAGGLAWDVGVIGYFYPSAGTEDLDFVEIYGGLGANLGGVDVGGYVYFDPDNENMYVEASAGYGFTDAFSADVSIGNYDFDGGGDYVNYSLGGTLSTEYVDFDLRFWATDIDDAGLNAEERVVLTISKSM